MSASTQVHHGARLKHAYGPNVHILDDAWSRSLLARLCHPDTDTRDFHPLLDSCFQLLVAAASEQLVTMPCNLPTRMTATEPRARLKGTIYDPSAPVVVVDVARGGMVPSLIFQRQLMEVLSPSAVRVDHIYMQRTSDPVTGAVTGIDHVGSKIGGTVDGATVFLPDPMAATGSSLAYVMGAYRDRLEGRPRRLIAVHLIVTPEYVRRITTEYPCAAIYALRLDRGMSSEEVLACTPGERWDEECGLDAQGYIVPGAGGVGEVINNAWV
jgi:uracil phosphoribosyltransferase